MCFSRTLLLHKNNRQTIFALFVMIACNHPEVSYETPIFTKTMPIVLVLFIFDEISSVKIFRLKFSKKKLLDNFKIILCQLFLSFLIGVKKRL
jgi:hypothetical protein